MNRSNFPEVNSAMSASLTVSELNRALARKINEEARDNRHSIYTGKFVGICSGEVVAVADDLDQLAWIPIQKKRTNI